MAFNVITPGRVRELFGKEGVPENTVDAFLDSFQTNPEVWKEFERFTMDAIAVGRTLGAKAIMERVRWETEVTRKERFKVSNNWTAYYARVFSYKHPEYADYFNFKAVNGVSV